MMVELTDTLRDLAVDLIMEAHVPRKKMGFAFTDEELGRYLKITQEDLDLLVSTDGFVVETLERFLGPDYEAIFRQLDLSGF